MRTSIPILLSLCCCLLICTPALADTEVVFFGTSTDGVVYNAQFVTVDTKGYEKVYLNNFPMWVAGSEASSATLEAMDKECVDDDLYSTGEVCKCFKSTLRVKFVGYCPCGGYCMYNGNSAHCSSIVV